MQEYLRHRDLEAAYAVSCISGWDLDRVVKSLERCAFL
jgi:hypothetical protein